VINEEQKLFELRDMYLDDCSGGLENMQRCAELHQEERRASSRRGILRATAID